MGFVCNPHGIDFPPTRACDAPGVSEISARVAITSRLLDRSALTCGAGAFQYRHWARKDEVSVRALRWTFPDTIKPKVAYFPTRGSE